MWRSVPGRNKLATVAEAELDSDDDDALGKSTKPQRASTSTAVEHDAAWVRKGYVLAAVALAALFLLSGFLTSRSPALTETITTPNVLRYLRTFNAPGADADDAELGAEFELDAALMDDPDSKLDATPAPRRDTNFAPAGCSAAGAKLKVFMYDLPPAFHYGMIAEWAAAEGQIWPRNVSDIPKYPGGLYQQHSPEYWLVSDLVTSDMPERRSPCTAFRVRRWQDADVLLVPFFASLSYNKYSGRSVGVGAGAGAGESRLADRNQELQSRLLAFLEAQPAWRARAARHVLVIHHPNSMVAKRARFRRGIFVVADFGRYGAEAANVAKDVVAPYKHVIPRFADDDAAAGGASFAARPTLLFFQGAIVRKQGGVIRQQLHALLRGERDVVFATGATTSAGIRSATAGMRGSKFCLHLAGDTPSSNRLFDAVASHCVPLIISDEIELPFEDVLDYSQFCLFVAASDALRKGFVTDLLRGVSVETWARMHARLREVQRHFQWQHPTELGDAVHMTWDAIARKVPALTLANNKRRRYARSRRDA